MNQNKATARKARSIDNAIALLNKKGAWTNEEIENAIAISYGNLKLKSDDNCRFIIWNIPAIITCPYRTALCEKACYAIKAEKNYPDVLPARHFNFEFSKTEYFVPFMIRLVHELATKPKYKAAKRIVFRIHESGDFYSYEYLLKWFTIAEACKDIEKLTFAAYTKSFPFIDRAFTSGIEQPANFVFRASIWADTPIEHLAIIVKYNMTIYTAYEKGKFPKQYAKCLCENCATCQMCFNAKVHKIACEIH